MSRIQKPTEMHGGLVVARGCGRGLEEWELRSTVGFFLAGKGDKILLILDLVMIAQSEYTKTTQIYTLKG